MPLVQDLSIYLLASRSSTEIQYIMQQKDNIPAIVLSPLMLKNVHA